MDHLQVKQFGPIETADINFGDLTVLVGPQASGKSLFVQLVKVLSDAAAIRNDLKLHGFEWIKSPNARSDFCSLYFGGGLGNVFQDNTILRRDDKVVNLQSIWKPGGNTNSDESVFLIPAQRVLVFQDGWPRPFMGYSHGDPYALRSFSEMLRLLMDSSFDPGEDVFPRPNLLKKVLRDQVNQSVYMGAQLKLESEGLRKRMVLSPREDSTLPMNAWSAGQREFTPLLLGLYWLMPAAKISMKDKCKIVIIEEPEMGLHPQAIVSFGLLALELLHRGYKVILSTHSPVILDLVWALRELGHVSNKTSAKQSRDALLKIFGIKKSTPGVMEIFESALTKKYHTYFFNRQDGMTVTHDISSLDPGADDTRESGWGGLTGYSGQIAEIVGEACASAGE